MQAITEKAVHCSRTNRLSFASCFLLGLGPMLFRENYIVIFIYKKKVCAYFIVSIINDLISVSHVEFYSSRGLIFHS